MTNSYVNSSIHLPTESLRTFSLVAELGSFTKAAQQLNRTQPAVSLQIQRLEQAINHALFLRTNGNLLLTPEGEILFGYSKRILALHNEAISALHQQSLSGQLRLGIPSEFASTLLPAIISQFSQDHPNISLDVNCDLSKQLMQDIERFQYDVILALHKQFEQRDVIKTEALVWVGAPQTKINTKDNLPLVVAPEGCIYRQRGIDALNKDSLNWRITYTNRDLSGIQAAIEADIGITVLTRSTVPKGLKILPAKKYGLPQLGHIGISLIPKNNSQAVEKLIQYIKKSL